MNKQYKKVDENNVEVVFTETITKRETLSLPKLVEERDLMLENILKNETICNTKNDKIRIRLKDIEEEIKLLTNMGIRSKVINPEIVVEEKKPEPVIVEEIKESPITAVTFPPEEILNNASSTPVVVGPETVEDTSVGEGVVVVEGIPTKPKKTKK